MGGHELHVRHPVALDRGQARFRVEVVHGDDGAAEALHGRRPTGRRGVVEGRGAQVHRALGHPEEPAHQGAEPVRRPERRADRRRLDALRPAGGAGRVEHPAAFGLVVDRSRGLRGEHGLVVVEARDLTADREPQGARLLPDVGHCVGDAGRHHERLGAAVVDDVVHLVGGQVPVHRRDVEARVHRAPEHLEVLEPVVHHDRDVIAGVQACAAYRVRQAAGAFVELGVGADRAALGVDRSRPVGRRLRVLPRVLHRHEGPPGNIQTFARSVPLPVCRRASRGWVVSAPGTRG